MATGDALTKSEPAIQGGQHTCQIYAWPLPYDPQVDLADEDDTVLNAAYAILAGLCLSSVCIVGIIVLSLWS